MGCSLRKNSQKNNQSHLSNRQQEQQNEIFYEELSNPIPNFQFHDWKMFNLKGRVYISFWHQDQKEFKLLNAQTNQVYSFNFQGHLLTTDITMQQQQLLILILTNKRLYQLQIIDCQLKILKQFFIKGIQKNGLYFSQQWKKLILMNNSQQIFMISQGLQSRSKIIFKTLFDTPIHSPYHNIQKGVFIYSHDQQFIKILDITSKQQKQVQIKCPGNRFNQIEIKYIKLTNEQIDVVFNIQGKGLFYNKINYPNSHIVSSKFLYYYVKYEQVYEDDGFVVLQTDNYFIQFDKDYKILQKFEINHNQVYHDQILQSFPGYFDISFCYWRGNIRKIGLFFIQRYQTNSMYNLILFKQKLNLSEGILWLKKVADYQLENYNDLFISQNHQYLAITYQYCLIFYKIKYKVEQQYFFDQEIYLVQFSNNSRYLYIQFHDRVICYICQENLKLSNQWFNPQFENMQLLACQSQLYYYQNYNFNFCQLTNKAKKKLFRIKGIEDRNIFTSRSMYMISNDDEIIIYRLADRKQFLRLTVENRDIRLMYNTQDLLILTKNKQLELWNFNAEHAIQFKVIINNVKNIYSIYFNMFVAIDQEQNIYLFDYHSFKILEFYPYNSTQNTEIIDQKAIIKGQDFIIYIKKKKKIIILVLFLQITNKRRYYDNNIN